MSLPVIGQDPWGEDLNAYLAALESRIALLEATPKNRASKFMYSINTSAPPASGQLRMDSTDRPSVTRLWFHNIDADGNDIKTMWTLLGTVDSFYIQDRDDSTKWVRYHATADPVDQGTYQECAVSFISDGGVALSAQQVGVVISEVV